MAKTKPPEIRLGRLELQIMNIVWDKQKATVHDVKEAISRGRKPAYTTILTMMRKLEAKGYLKHEVDDLRPLLLARERQELVAAVIHYHRMLAYEALGKMPEADVDRQKILELGFEPGPHLF